MKEQNEQQGDALQVYEFLAIKSASMLDAARRDDWDAVSSFEQECSKLIGQLKTSEGIAPLSSEARNRKVQIIRRMLLEDAEIRDLAQPQLANLARLIRLSGTHMRVENAYM